MGIIMESQQFKSGKNDFFFGFVMVAMFVVTVAVAVAGALDLGHGHAGQDFAKKQASQLAHAEMK
jgi:hypothetical protein